MTPDQTASTRTEWKSEGFFVSRDAQQRPSIIGFPTVGLTERYGSSPGL